MCVWEELEIGWMGEGVTKRVTSEQRPKCMEGARQEDSWR